MGFWVSPEASRPVWSAASPTTADGADNADGAASCIHVIRVIRGTPCRAGSAPRPEAIARVILCLLEKDPAYRLDAESARAGLVWA